VNYSPHAYGLRSTCDTCIKCEACPDMHESYRRGFRAGVETTKEEVTAAVGRALFRVPTIR
jgi:hypothetical protein